MKSLPDNAFQHYNITNSTICDGHETIKDTLNIVNASRRARRELPECKSLS